jgi:hypothetical protein
MPESVFKILTLALAIAVVAACGGGGGGGGGGGDAAATAAWGQEAYVKAVNTDSGDQQGFGVAISGDTLVVGALGEASNQNTITNGTTASADDTLVDAGAVYVYRRSGATWGQEAYLKAPNVDAGDGFGEVVAIDGDTIVVGASSEDSNQTTVSNGTTASGNNSAAAAGAAYVFRRTGSTWAQEAYLKGSNIGAGANFGYAVAISGDTIVVGAHGEGASTGAAYVFKRTGTTWAQEARLTAVNGEAGDDFGFSVAISGDSVVVAAIGEASSQQTITNGTGASADNAAASAGAAYVFKRTGSTWAQEAYLKAPNAEANDNFGWSVAISGDTVIAGAPSEQSNQRTVSNGTTASANNSSSEAGAAYVFKRTGTNWAHEAYLKAANADAGDNFGLTVAVQGDGVVVGAFRESAGQTTVTNGSSASSDNSRGQSGAAYVFRRSGSAWGEVAYLKAANTGAGDQFGTCVGIDGDTIATGATGEASNQASIINGATASSDDSAASAGAAYVYRYR